MAERIVVAFFAEVEPATLAFGDAHAKALIELRSQAEAQGGRLSAVGAEVVVFDFASDELEEAVGLALSAIETRKAAESPRLCVGIARGELTPLADTGSLAAPSWGPPLVVAIGLANTARKDEILVDPAMAEVLGGEVLTTGSRVGKQGKRRVRGLVLDARHPFRRQTVEENIARLSRPAFALYHGLVAEVLTVRAPLTVVRADAGFGGTRLLEEIGVALLPGRSLYLTAAGAEPLGALRRAVARSLASGGALLPGQLAPSLEGGLERLLAGEGLPLERAAELVALWVSLPPRHGDGAKSADGHAHVTGAALVDDAMEIDDPSLEAVVKAARLLSEPLPLVVRLDGTSPLPPAFEGMRSSEIRLAAFSRVAGEKLASDVSSGQLGTEASKRWARRGRYVPLAIVEAVAEGATSGELRWIDDLAVPRDRSPGKKPQYDAREWIARRLAFAPPADVAVLEAIATLGVVVPTSLAREFVARVCAGDPDLRFASLRKSRWLRDDMAEFCALPSHTHRDAVLAGRAPERAVLLHEVASFVVAARGGRLAHAEAARHAVMAGNAGRAAELALVAARACSELRLDAATEALLAFAGARPEDIAPPPLTLPANTWIEALRASSDGVKSRLEAIAALTKGQTAEALSVLREGVEEARQGPPAVRSRASLAYGIGLAAVGRHGEALMSALDALARAREVGEARGEQACARFLARLSVAAGYDDAAVKWRAILAG
ncbi:MAG TPA: hypothetical protein VJT73_20920 [Polyangiaceae bacterium]|nr:hypothetical protein [Polyangiaceae bacterium]